MAILGSLLPPIAVDLLATASVFALAGAAHTYFHLRKAFHDKARQESQMSEVINHLPEGFYRIGRDGRFVYANRAFMNMHGYGSWAEFQQSMNGPATDVYVEPGRRDAFLAALDRDGEIHGFVSEIRLPKTGARIWVNESARQVRDPLTGDLLHYEGTVRETTGVVERMKSEARLQKLTQHLPGGLFQLVRAANGTFSVVFASQGFCDMLDRRFSPEGFDIDHFISLIHPEDLADYYESLKLSRKNAACVAA